MTPHAVNCAGPRDVVSAATVHAITTSCFAILERNTFYVAAPWDTQIVPGDNYRDVPWGLLPAARAGPRDEPQLRNFSGEVDFGTVDAPTYTQR